MTSTPVVTIFVRHSPGCRYSGNEFDKRCSCRKHLRWSQGGKQFRKTAGTRTWGKAEKAKRDLEDQLNGIKLQTSSSTSAKSISEAVETFIQDKRNQGVSEKVLDKYSRELNRLED